MRGGPYHEAMWRRQLAIWEIYDTIAGAILFGIVFGIVKCVGM